MTLMRRSHLHPNVRSLSWESWDQRSNNTRNHATTRIENYRPILNTIFKIRENILYEKLKDKLNLKQVIHIAQFGSQKEKGATDVILAINILGRGTNPRPNPA